MKKIALILLIAVLIVLGYLFIPKGGDSLAQVGEEFSLSKGETVYLEGKGDPSLSVTEFIYSPCPEDAQCIWEGLDVLYTFTYEGIPYARGEFGNVPYTVELIDSDYQSYATFRVDMK